MVNTRLISVDGIPGSGKSTTSRSIHDRLVASGIDSLWFHELSADHPIHRHEVHPDDPNEYMDFHLDLWTSFLQNSKTNKTVFVFDCTLLQYLTAGLMFFDVQESSIQKHFIETINIIRTLNPVIVYLYNPSVRNTLSWITAKRGDEFSRRFIAGWKSCKYWTRLGLDGFDGMVTFFEDQQEVAMECMERSAVNKIIIDRTNHNFVEDDATITEFIGLRTELTQVSNV